MKTKDMLRESIQALNVAAMRAARITRPDMPAIKHGRYSFVAKEVVRQEVTK